MRPIPANHSFTMRLRVTREMIARFFDCTIHPVYATFAIVEHGEYAARQAILPFLEEWEDAVGAHVELEHTAAVAVGTVVEITASVTQADERAVTCSIVASTADGVIARGTNRQRVVPKQKLRERIDALYRSRQHQENDGRDE